MVLPLSLSRNPLISRTGRGPRKYEFELSVSKFSQHNITLREFISPTGMTNITPIPPLSSVTSSHQVRTNWEVDFDFYLSCHFYFLKVLNIIADWSQLLCSKVGREVATRTALSPVSWMIKVVGIRWTKRLAISWQQPEFLAVFSIPLDKRVIWTDSVVPSFNKVVTRNESLTANNFRWDIRLV